MHAFIARDKETGEEIIVVWKDDMIILQYPDWHKASEKLNDVKIDFRREGREIIHIPSDAPEVKKARKVKRVEIMKGRYILEEEE